MLVTSDNLPQHIRAWEQGAHGEEVVGAGLEWQQGVLVLHDRRVPGTTSNIDHVAVGPSGVFVIDAKSRTGKRPRRQSGRLRIGRRDESEAVDAMHDQVEVVRAALRAINVPIVPVLCIVDANWPWIGGSFVIDGVHVQWPKKTYALVRRPGPLSPDHVASVQNTLARTLRPA